MLNSTGSIKIHIDSLVLNIKYYIKEVSAYNYVITDFKVFVEILEELIYLKGKRINFSHS